MGKKNPFAASKDCTGNTANTTILIILRMMTCLIKAVSCDESVHRGTSQHTPYQWVTAANFCLSRTAELSETITSTPHILVTLILELAVWSHASTAQFATVMDCFDQYLRYNATK